MELTNKYYKKVMFDPSDLSNILCQVSDVGFTCRMKDAISFVIFHLSLAYFVLLKKCSAVFYLKNVQ